MSHISCLMSHISCLISQKNPPTGGFFIYAILETFLANREILRAARFFGMILPADFMILLSALRAAVVAAALSPDSIATNAFLVAVLTMLRRDVLIAFFLAVTKILFSDDLWFATLFSFYFRFDFDIL